MSNQSQWDPSAALRAGKLASTIASELREYWEEDVWSALPQETSVFGLGAEADYHLVEEIRLQVMESLEVVITCSGLAVVYNVDSDNLDNLTWDVSCRPDSYDWIPQLRRGRLGCIATVFGTGVTDLVPVELPIHVLTPVQNWEHATSRQLGAALRSDKTVTARLRDCGQAAMVEQMGQALLDKKGNAFEIWNTQVRAPLTEDRMWVSADINATIRGHSSVRVDATYSGWVWGDSHAHSLPPCSVTVQVSGSRTS